MWCGGGRLVQEIHQLCMVTKTDRGNYSKKKRHKVFDETIARKKWQERILNAR